MTYHSHAPRDTDSSGVAFSDDSDGEHELGKRPIAFKRAVTDGQTRHAVTVVDSSDGQDKSPRRRTGTNSCKRSNTMSLSREASVSRDVASASLSEAPATSNRRNSMPSAVGKAGEVLTKLQRRCSSQDIRDNKDNNDRGARLRNESVEQRSVSKSARSQDDNASCENSGRQTPEEGLPMENQQSVKPGSEWIAKVQSTEEVRSKTKETCKQLFLMMEVAGFDLSKLECYDRFRLQDRFAAEIDGLLQLVAKSAFDSYSHEWEELNSLRTVVSELDDKIANMNRTYLLEVSSTRDRHRTESDVVADLRFRFGYETAAQAGRAVEFYEPLEYLSKDVKSLCLGIIDEKIKAIFSFDKTLKEKTNPVEMARFEDAVTDDRLKSFEKQNAKLRDENREVRNKFSRLEKSVEKSTWELAQTQIEVKKLESELSEIRNKPKCDAETQCAFSEPPAQTPVNHRRPLLRKRGSHGQIEQTTPQVPSEPRRHSRDATQDQERLTSPASPCSPSFAPPWSPKRHSASGVATDRERALWVQGSSVAKLPTPSKCDAEVQVDIPSGPIDRTRKKTLGQSASRTASSEATPGTQRKRSDAFQAALAAMELDSRGFDDAGPTQSQFVKVRETSPKAQSHIQFMKAMEDESNGSEHVVLKGNGSEDVALEAPPQSQFFKVRRDSAEARHAVSIRDQKILQLEKELQQAQAKIKELGSQDAVATPTHSASISNSDEQAQQFMDAAREALSSAQQRADAEAERADRALQQIEILQQEVRTLRDEINAAKAEVAKSEQRRIEIVSACTRGSAAEELSSALANAARERANLLEEVEQLKGALSMALSRNAALEVWNYDRDEPPSTQKSKAKSHTIASIEARQLENLQGQKGELRDKISIQKEQLAELVQENTMLHLALQEMQNEVLSLTKQLRGSLPDIEVMNADLEVTLSRMDKVVKNGGGAYMRLHKEQKLRDIATTVRSVKNPCNDAEVDVPMAAQVSNQPRTVSKPGTPSTARERPMIRRMHTSDTGKLSSQQSETEIMPKRPARMASLDGKFSSQQSDTESIPKKPLRMASLERPPGTPGPGALPSLESRAPSRQSPRACPTPSHSKPSPIQTPLGNFEQRGNLILGGKGGMAVLGGFGSPKVKA